MTGVKGQKWKKPHVVKYKKGIQLTQDEMDHVNIIAKEKEWSVAKVIYKIFQSGLNVFRGKQ